MKRSSSDPTKTYPDFGCSFETFTNNDFLEMETLGPLGQGAARAHGRASGALGSFHNVVLIDWTDEALDRVLLPLVKSVGSTP